MLTFRESGTRRRRCSALCLAALVSLCLAAPRPAAAQVQPITRIEEDWSLQIGEPNPEDNSPQVFIVTSPTGNLSGLHSVFEINNLSLPDYYGGGLQLQAWNGKTNVSSRHHTDLKSLATTGEFVTFTVQLKIGNNAGESDYQKLRFKVLNGKSQTWGEFGGDGMSMTHSTSLSDLSGYSPETSVKNSRVGYAGNRVNSLVLKRVRYYSGNTLVSTDETERTAFDIANLSESE